MSGNPSKGRFLSLASDPPLNPVVGLTGTVRSTFIHTLCQLPIVAGLLVAGRWASHSSVTRPTLRLQLRLRPCPYPHLDPDVLAIYLSNHLHTPVATPPTLPRDHSVGSTVEVVGIAYSTSVAGEILSHQPPLLRTYLYPEQKRHS